MARIRLLIDVFVFRVENFGLFVDDNLDNLNKWSLNNPYGHDLLMTDQHNNQIQDERRINSFKEADDYIKTIQFLMSVRAGIKALEK